VYAPGHYGVSLLAYAPVGGSLLAAGRPDFALAGGAIVLWLATLPDVDHHLPLVEHRGVTHTVPFAIGVGAVLGGVAHAIAPLLPVLESPTLAAAFVGAMGTYGILAHLLGDVLTPAGVPLLWPLSGRAYSLSLWTAKNPVANYLLLGLGAFATAVTAVGVGAV
jgi:inner membrane protein